MTQYRKNGFGWGHVFLLLFLIFVLAGIFTPLIFRESHSGPRTEALLNAKAIAGALFAFKEEYGTYPCAESRETLRHAGETRLRDGDDANAYLAQLFVTGIFDSELYFYVAGVDYCKKPDDRFSTSETLLAEKENGFIYIMTENDEPLTDVSSITPLVMAPVKSKGDVPLFDPDPFGEQYVYGAADGSGRSGKIGPAGLPTSKGRAHLFGAGSDSLFGTETPVVKYPLGF